MLLGRRDGALKEASPHDSLSLTAAGACPDAPAGTQWIANVVFPTGIDRRDDFSMPDRFDVYYGTADNRIGVARLDVPAILPPGGIADLPEAIE